MYKRLGCSSGKGPGFSSVPSKTKKLPEAFDYANLVLLQTLLPFKSFFCLLFIALLPHSYLLIIVLFTYKIQLINVKFAEFYKASV